MRKQRSKLVTMWVLESGTLFADSRPGLNDPRVQLASYLVGDVQSSGEFARHLLTGIEWVKDGRAEEWEFGGNGFTVYFTKDGVDLIPHAYYEEVEEYRLPIEHYTLDELRDALEDWLDLIAEVYPHAAAGRETVLAEMLEEQLDGQRYERSRRRREGRVARDDPPTPVDRKTVERVLADHRLWTETRPRQGQVADFDGMLLRDLDFSGMDLGEAGFQNARLERCRFVGSDLSYALFGGAVAVDCDFTRAVLAGASLDAGDFRGCRFDGATISRAILNASDFRGTSFRGADLNRSGIVHCDLRGAVFDGAKLGDATFANCRVEGARWAGATPPPTFKTDSRVKPLGWLSRPDDA